MKKVLKWWMVYAMVLCLLMIGCSTEKAQASTSENVREIVDCSGHVVVLPKAEAIQTVVIASPPIVTMTSAILHDSSKIAGIHPLALTNANADVLHLVMPTIESMDGSYVKGFSIDVEKLISLNPDVVFCYGEQERKALESINVPIVDFYKSGEKDAANVVAQWSALISEVFEVTPEYTLEAELEKVKQYKESLTSETAEQTALFIFNNSSGKIIVSGSQTYGDYWLNYAGLKNVANAIEGEKEVSMEQILKWQPDRIYIFMGPGKDAYIDGIENQAWSRLEAVKNESIYDIPVGAFHWASPSMDTPLMMKWILLDTAEQEGFKAEIKTYYENVYGIEITEKMVEDILSPKRDEKTNEE